MYRSGLIVLLFLAAPAFAQDGTEIRPAPNHVVRDASQGCLVGGSTGAVLSAIGTVGLGMVPATALGCGVGAAVGPMAADVYERYKFQAYLAVDRAITGIYGWWQEQKIKDGP
jgi:ABC-type nitrate/sulfonate/bicarbonate transport system permease component